ncbi:IS66 family insertion sequence element accessory protein TnpB [Marinobacter sp.]|uniref:IS66 family insertion sequence element accessory protein TnpB n=1 Tax=Marinobacter sp. TaxID=50741 RepID=UPI003A9297E4
MALIVERELGHSLFSGALYAFTNRQRNKVKCLMWEDNGFVLYYKALAEEKFKWPGPSDELMSLTGEQINWLAVARYPCVCWMTSRVSCKLMATLVTGKCAARTN